MSASAEVRAVPNCVIILQIGALYAASSKQETNRNLLIALDIGLSLHEGVSAIIRVSILVDEII